MRNRLRMLMGATALLYFGPLLAGLGAFGWAVVPVFAAIFMLWLVIIRPQEFPRSVSEWLQAEALVAFAARAAVQLLLVLVCFGIGRGIGGVLGSLPPFPLMLPIAISFLSIPLARMIWDPSKVDAMDKLLDAALTKIEGQVGAGPLPGGDRAYAEAVTAPLNGLADDVAEEELENHLSAIRALVDENMTFDVLLARAQNGDASTAGKCALMVMASDAAAIDRMDKQDVPLRAMDALSGDPALVARMAERLIKALRMDADIWYQCPNVGFLENLRQQAPSISDELSALEAEIVAQAPRD